MFTHLRMPDSIYQDELDQICLPQWALAMLHNALSDPRAAFYHDVVSFLSFNFFVPGDRMEEAFQVLQRDLVRGRVLISRRLMDYPAFVWVPGQDDDDPGHWKISPHALPEHQAMLQWIMDNAKTMFGGPRVQGSVDWPSAVERDLDKVKGAAKQVVNDVIRRAAAINAEWQAEEGKAVFTDSATGEVLSADEVKARWEAEGKDVVPINGEDQQAGAQMAKDAPAMGAVVGIAQTAASRGRNIIQHPEDLSKDITKSVQGLRGPKDKQLSEALGKIGGEQAKRRQGMKTDPRYVDRYHGPDDMTRDSNDKLGEWEFKGNKADSKAVAKDSNGNRQGSKEKNDSRAKKMVKDKSHKVDLPSNRQGGPYTQEEIELWQEVKDSKGDKQHFSVHTNTETGMVRTYERNGNDEPKMIEEFKMDNFDEIKQALQELLK